MMTEIENAQVKQVTLQSTITAHNFYTKMGFFDDGTQQTLVINGMPIRCFPMKLQLEPGLR